MKAKEREELLRALQDRFERNMHRHAGIAWTRVQARLESNPDALTALHAMEATGGEPDVIGEDKNSGHLMFCDCSPERLPRFASRVRLAQGAISAGRSRKQSSRMLAISCAH